MDIENKRILVTGGAGFIGSNLANRLATNNTVISVDDCYLGTPENLERSVDFRERSVLDSGLPTDVDVVFHLAALSSYAMHESNPQLGARINVEGFTNVVEQAREDGCDTIVYASTSSLYGTRETPSPESTPITVNTGYEASKRAREAYAEYFSNHYDMSLAGLRLFSVYGGYADAERHKGVYANIVSQFADDIARDVSPALYGDGTQSRDFVHVSDVVSAFVAAAANELDGVYNIGTGESYSFNSAIELINDELDADVEPEYVENPIPSDVYVKYTCADTTKFRRATGWRPRIGFHRGIELVCEPYR